MVLTSFKEESDAQNETPVFIFDASFDRYREVIDSTQGTLTFAKAFGNSFFVVSVSTLIVLLLAIPAAYSLAIRPIEKWRDVLFFFISTKFLPIAAAILPLFFFARFFSLLDTRTVLVIVYTALNLPLAVWMMRSFFNEVPKELIEAAQIDGASLFSQLRSVILPIVSPGIAATALLCFIFAWNEYFLALNLTTFDAQTVPLWVTTNVDSRGPFLAKLSAAATVASIPVIAAGWIAQKRLVRGLAMGAIK
jgi:sorbitol/mannitol transport system permease protein